MNEFINPVDLRACSKRPTLVLLRQIDSSDRTPLLVIRGLYCVSSPFLTPFSLPVVEWGQIYPVLPFVFPLIGLSS